MFDIVLCCSGIPVWVGENDCGGREEEGEGEKEEVVVVVEEEERGGWGR